MNILWKKTTEVVIIKKNCIFKLLLLISTVLVSCSFFNPANSNKNEEKNPQANGIKTMYFEFSFDGESLQNNSYKIPYGDGVKDMIFQMAPGAGNSYTFKGEGRKGFDTVWWFANNNGKEFSIPFYIGNEILKKDYRSSDKTVSISPNIDLGMASASGGAINVFNGVVVYGTLFTADLKNYYEDQHTNVAQFHVHFYEIEKEKFPGSSDKIYSIEYTITFNGFKKK